jgi:broad specificity phosphatase PhoE
MKLYIVRHGMRLDYEDKSWKATAERPFDPPLSPTGFRQAAQTGGYLAGEGITAVYASPLIRAMQTATEIAEQLNLPIHVEPGLTEWLNPKWYDYSAGTFSAATLAHSYPIVRGYVPLAQPRYPEQEEKICRARCTFVGRQLAREATGNIVLITHGVCVLNMVEGLTGSRAGAKDGVCAVNIVQPKWTGGWQLEKVVTSHLV